VLIWCRPFNACGCPGGGCLPVVSRQALRRSGPHLPAGLGQARCFPGGQRPRFPGKDLCPARGERQRKAGCGHRRRGADWPQPGGTARRAGLDYHTHMTIAATSSTLHRSW